MKFSGNILKISIVLILSGLSFLLPGQDNKSTEEPVMKYYRGESFLVEGTTFMDSVKENLFDRLPASYKNKVRPPVWSLSKSSAGISVSFLTNSTIIKVKWDILNDEKMNHMAATGTKGLDLYCKTENGWQFVNTARPTGKSNEFLLISNMKNGLREFKIYFSLYDGVTSLKIGIDSLSTIEKPHKAGGKPIVFYGTSITQGGCASRPGMAHTNIISRKLDVECINFGFSGNGEMEKPIAELISGIDALFYVMDGVGNMSPEQIHQNAIPLVRILRSKHPATPIIFVECTWFEKTWFDEKSYEEIRSKNDALKSEYRKMKDMGLSNIFYIATAGATGNDHEGTVDSIHLTDLGFLRYADFLIAEFRKIKPVKALL